MKNERIELTQLPQVVSLLHLPWTRRPIAVERELLVEGEKAIVRHIRRAAAAATPRRLFIEGLGASLGPDVGPDPYSRAIEEALKRGWKVIGLDRRSRLLASQRPPPYSLQQLFFMHDGRERDWPKVLHSHDIRSTDLVVIHPTHVPGFLRHSGISASSVLWIHHPFPLLSSTPLTEAQLAGFLSEAKGKRLAKKRQRR